MSAQPSRTDDADSAERNFSSSSNAANSLHPNPAISHEAQATSANHHSDNQLDVEATEAETRLRRRSATSSSSAANRRASRLSFNYSQGRAQPHHHHHTHHQVPQPQHNFRPFTRDSFEAIKGRIEEENARKLQLQAQHEVSVAAISLQPPPTLTIIHCHCRATLRRTHRPLTSRILESRTQCSRPVFLCHVPFSETSHPS